LSNTKDSSANLFMMDLDEKYAVKESGVDEK